jgi:hypothetical protein
MLTDIKTRYGNYKVDFLSADTYRADDSPAIRAWSMEDGPIATITVCLDDDRLEPNQSYVDTNNCPWAPEWIEENGLGRNTGKRARSGYCTYPLYEFDMLRIQKERART